MNFCIYDVKKVQEVSDTFKAQQLIDEGWTLLCVCPISTGETSDKCYILGMRDFELAQRDIKEKTALTEQLSNLENN